MAETTNHVESEEAQRAKVLQEIENEEREEKRQAQAATELRKIERWQLKKRFEKETGGTEGQAFAILETAAGVFVLLKREAVLYKQLIKGATDENEIEKFVELSAAYPDKDKVKKAFDEYPGIVRRLLDESVKLYGVMLEDRQKK